MNSCAKPMQAGRKTYWDVRCQPQELLECSDQLACKRQGFPHAAGCNAAGGLSDHPSMMKGCCGNEPRALLGCRRFKMLSILHNGDVSKPSCLWQDYFSTYSTCAHKAFPELRWAEEDASPLLSLLNLADVWTARYLQQEALCQGKL